MENLKNIGKNIKIARLKKGFSQEKLAELCGVSDRHIGLLERGQTSGSIPLIIDICNVLDVSPNFVFRDIIKNNDNTILPNDISDLYINLDINNQKFVQETIKHLYKIQNK